MTAPNPKILAEAIKRSEADMQLFRGIDDPEIKKLVEFCDVILVAAKACEPMREALEKAAREFERLEREYRRDAKRLKINWDARSTSQENAYNSAAALAITNERFAAMCRAAFNSAGPV